ncbi:Uncharacterised protein [Pannonibacter phragmitetus]|uniref:Uncharacterized protein n=1 Tax=Pannonibacter phragmitetus TaxID=121719 RepID=A0A379A1I7_9HYPH|nr:hypothetical protein [Pannonibacter phragmitetus]SUB03009.1 Uncharacterised protein [Pannonibacter phragmitetus]
MPVVQVHVAPEIAGQAGLKAREIGEIIEQGLISLLSASPDKIQIAIVAALAMPKGCQLLVAVDHRASDERPKPIRDELAHQIATQLHGLLGASIRVRLIGIDPAYISACDIHEAGR